MLKTYRKEGVTVIMPVYNQASFITRAINSLKAQTVTNWELIIINDGSTDNLKELIPQLLKDSRITCLENRSNKGLGVCLNMGIAASANEYIAYLPADDVYYKDHLAELRSKLDNARTVLAFSGVRHHYNRQTTGQIDGYPLQLVQVMHKKTDDRWTERDELVTDDLNRMYWSKILKRGISEPTGKISCEWVDHPRQRHKIIQEPVGGINPYKEYYGVKQPLRYHTTTGNFIDEISYYQPFRNRTAKSHSNRNGLKIVITGELAYNAERIIALEEQGHKLYGLWMKEPYWYNTIGPLPFGNVEDIPYENWKKRLEEIQPDIIYGLLNWQAVPMAHEILMNNPGFPFVWHFKEGPFICLEKGTWNQLIDLYTWSDGQIYTSPEMRDWFLQFLPGQSPDTLVFDGDLPKKEWFRNTLSPRLSEADGEIHTVVPGRPIGLHPHTVAEMAAQEIHLHFYGDFTHGQWKQWIEKTRSLAPGYLHTHANVTQENWAREFSQYDAGWLHFFSSENHGELMRANWDDLNYPARMATLAVAGLPMLQRDNTGHIVATQTLVRDHKLGIFFSSMEELGRQLRDKEKMEHTRKNVWDKRFAFSFDYHVDTLVSFFRKVIESKPAGSLRKKVSA